MQYLKAPVNVRADWTVYSSIGKPLADIYGSEDDARLIAAAPAMLAALQALVNEYAPRKAKWESAVAAIARATGKA